MSRFSTGDAEDECGRRPNLVVVFVSIWLDLENTKPSPPNALRNRNGWCPLRDRIVLALGYIADVEDVRRVCCGNEDVWLNDESGSEGRMIQALRIGTSLNLSIVVICSAR